MSGFVMDRALILYHGTLVLSDFYKDIDRGFDYFIQTGFSYVPNISYAAPMIIHVSPRYYFHFPIVEVMNYYMAKRFKKSLSVMALTALHEAISNSLLWGLLKVRRPQEIFEFHSHIEEHLEECERKQQTITLMVDDRPDLTVRIINPYDKDFSLDSIQTSPSPYIRGSELMSLFSQMQYDKSTNALELTFGELDNVYQTVAQS